jgi:hypothetical protein
MTCIMTRVTHDAFLVFSIFALTLGCRGHSSRPHDDGGVEPDSDEPYDGPLTTVTGRVWSPNSLVPISGAVVFFTGTEPPPVPPGAYPETCVEPQGLWVLSNPDGRFRLPVPPGTYVMVTQKGQFRRVREITVPETDEELAIDEALTTLPMEHGTGDTIPSIAVVVGIDRGDNIEDLLAKLGLGEVGSDQRLVRGTERFDIYNVAGYQPNTVLLEDLETMLSYHIIFFPCTVGGVGGEDQLADPTDPLLSPAVLGNVRAYLEAGGKIYATDMMYDVFEQPLPEYVDFCGDDARINAADEEAWAHFETANGWTSVGRAVDGDLAAWLEAIGEGSAGIQFRQNFVWIEELISILDPSPEDPATPKIWVEGDFILNPAETLPLTITFPYGPGRVLFSTYHTVGDEGGNPGHPGIYTQEYVLLYLIMEIGVCEEPLY